MAIGNNYQSPPIWPGPQIQPQPPVPSPGPAAGDYPVHRLLAMMDPSQREKFMAERQGLQPGSGQLHQQVRDWANSMGVNWGDLSATRTPPIYPGGGQMGGVNPKPGMDQKPGWGGAGDPSADTTGGIYAYGQGGSMAPPGGSAFQPGIGPTGFLPPPPGFGGTNPQFQTGGGMQWPGAGTNPRPQTGPGFQSRPPYGGQGPVNQPPAGGDQMYKPPRPTRGPRMTKPNESRQMRPRPGQGNRRPRPGTNPRNQGY